MAQFISLEEAARTLGISPEELKQKAQNREIRAFQDRGSWQFRQADIEEEARRRGMGSDPDLSLSDLDLEVPEGTGSQDVDLSEFQLGVATPDLGAGSQPEVFSTSDQDVAVDDMALPPELSGSSSTIIGMKPAGKLPSDSDVKLMPEEPSRTAADSDVRLSPPPRPRPSDSDVTLVSDDSSSDMPVQAGGDDPNATTLARSPLLGSSAEIEAVGHGEDSDFELTPSSVIDALQPDSGSDFELTALDASDEFEATPAPKPKRGPSDSDVTGIEPSASGINLGKPSDSGINLATGAFDFASADSIELAPLDDEEEPKPAPKPAAKAKPVLEPKDDPGATALPIKTGAEKDIFEDTDFEVDALDTGDDRTMQLEATSDFDIDEGDSASEVFAIDEDDVDQNAATAMAAAPALDEDLFGAGGEDEGEAGDAWGDVSGDEPAGAAVAAPSAAAVAAPGAAPAAAAPRGGTLLSAAAGPDWPTWVVVLLGLTTVFMLLLAFVGLDLVSNLYEFRGDGPSSGLVKALAGLMGGS
jgi:hypothetical protein